MTTQAITNHSHAKSAASTNGLNTMRWLIKREFWENKGLFVWGPVAIAISICLAYFATAIIASPWQMQAGILSNAKLMEREPHAALNFATYFIATMKEAMPVTLQMLIFLMLCVGGFVSIIYLMSTLHTERADRSVLFWKSLPISDWQTVLSKSCIPLFILPVMLWMIATVLFFIFIFLYAIISTFTSLNLFGTLMLNPELYALPFRVLALLPVYALWALPSVGWYLMISAWAKSRVFPWAIGLPILTVVIALFLNKSFHLEWDIRWYATHIVAHLTGGVFPASWLLEQSNIGLPQYFFTLENISKQAWLAVQGPGIWIGAIAGVLMSTIAIRTRRFGDSDR
jgi:ABC-2 type transport system permease protein